MKKDIKELKDNLEKIITSYNSNNKIKEFVKKALTERGISAGEFSEVWGNPKSLEDVEDMPFLYLATKELYARTSEPSINPEDFFTETEIKDGDIYVRENIEDKLEFPLVFENVIRGKDGRFLMFWDLPYIKKLFDSELATYNFETQRDPKMKLDKEGELIKVANVNKKSIKEIVQEFVNHDFIENILSFNLLQDGNENYEYNPKTHRLVVYSGQINPIDGFHRDLSIIEALMLEPSLDNEMEIRFTNWNAEKCRKFIKQEDKRNKISQRYLESVVDVNKMGNKVVVKLNESSSDIKGKIASDIKVIKLNKAYTLTDIMSNTIDYLWDLKTNMDVNNLANYLCEFFDNIIDYKKDDFINSLAESKQQRVITLPATFVGYLTLAKHLQSQENYSEKLFSILDKIDFDINNRDWIALKIVNKELKPIVTLSKPDIKRIVNFYEKMI